MLGLSIFIKCEKYYLAVYIRSIKIMFYWREVKTTWSDYTYPAKQNQYDTMVCCVQYIDIIKQ